MSGEKSSGEYMLCRALFQKKKLQISKYELGYESGYSFRMRKEKIFLLTL